MVAELRSRRILMVDDEPRYADIVRPYLEAEGFALLAAADGRGGLATLRREPADLVLLDLNLPDVSGIEVFRSIRTFSNVPVIMVTTRGDEIDRIVGLEIGADDYVAKPFSSRELVARVKCVLRRFAGEPFSRDGKEETCDARGLLIDRRAHEVRLAAKTLAVTPIEFRLLKIFADNPGRVFTRGRLIEMLGPDRDNIYDRTLDRHVANLRRKLGDDPDRPTFIETVLGVGYRFLAA